MKDSFQWPLISICPFYYYIRNGSNRFEDAVLEIEELKQNIQMLCMTSNVRADYANFNPADYMHLQIEEQLQRNTNFTIDEIVTFSVSAHSANFIPVVCFSIDLSKLDMSPFSYFMVSMLDDKPTGFVVMNSEPFDFDPSLGDQRASGYFMILKHIHTLRSITMERSKRLSTKKYVFL